MRPGQKNRMRGGRGNNSGRRGPNPLTRSYESNGPDVKVRGTPQHIAEKYVQLARDAHSSGDTVMAEGYLQHAEHYYRIIAAAQNAQQQAWNQANGIPVSEAELAEDEDEFEVAGADRFTFRAPPNFQQPQNGMNPQQPYQQQGYGNDPGTGEQPPIPEGQPPMGGENGQQPYGQQGYGQQQPRGDRQFGNRNRFDRRFGRDRNERGDRNFGDRPQGSERPNGERNGGERNGGEGNGERQGRERSFGEGRQQGERQPYQPRHDDVSRSDSGRAEGGRGDNADGGRDEAALPSFITAPSRGGAMPEGAPVDEAGGGEAAETGIRRRRRRTRPDAPAGGEE
jgi:hypothetical protein